MNPQLAFRKGFQGKSNGVANLRRTRATCRWAGSESRKRMCAIDAQSPTSKDNAMRVIRSAQFPPAPLNRETMEPLAKRQFCKSPEV